MQFSPLRKESQYNAGEKEQRHHQKVLQRRSTEETEKNIIRNDALSLVLNISVFYMTMPPFISPQ